ncbi:unnamed protein product [Gordionus sp. m RMFG-2023]|uniref:microspherule protein 1-like n=1 Tax=Gordionus sp. m RMFG-2023 TaxID=3053472 RepID=UPI0030E00851
METSLRRSSRPVKKKKFFQDEMLDIYSYSKKDDTNSLQSANDVHLSTSSYSSNIDQNIGQDSNKGAKSKDEEKNSGTTTSVAYHEKASINPNSSLIDGDISYEKSNFVNPMSSASTSRLSESRQASRTSFHQRQGSSKFSKSSSGNINSLKRKMKNQKNKMADTNARIGTNNSVVKKSNNFSRTSSNLPKYFNSNNTTGIMTDQFGKWKPVDDIKLIINTIQSNDLRRVKQCVTFTCNFSLKEIEERWYRLLYDPILSSLAKKAIKQQLNKPEILAASYRNALFSQEEESILSTIISNRHHTLDQFEQILRQYPSIFLPTRTAKDLQDHWLSMKHHVLLPDQIVNSSSKWNNPFTGSHTTCSPNLQFSDMENLLLISNESNDPSCKSATPHHSSIHDAVPEQPHSSESKKSTTPSDNIQKIRDYYPYFAKKSMFDKEYDLDVVHRFQKIDRLENELPMWQSIIDKEIGSNAEFDDCTFAVLQGRAVKFLIKSREVSFGRFCNNFASAKPIDIDLTLEGPCRKVSRLQGHFKLKASSLIAPSSSNNNNLSALSHEFYITNEGHRPFFLEGKPILPGHATKCRDKSLIEISYLQFTFFVNHRLINQLKQLPALI